MRSIGFKKASQAEYINIRFCQNIRFTIFNSTEFRTMKMSVTSNLYKELSVLQDIFWSTLAMIEGLQQHYADNFS